MNNEYEVFRWKKDLKNWLFRFNEDLGSLRHLEAEFAWKASTDIASKFDLWLEYVQRFKNEWIMRWCLKAKSLHDVRGFLNGDTTDRQLYQICQAVTPSIAEVKGPDDASLTDIFHGSMVCGNFGFNKTCLHGEPELAWLMERERNPIKLWEYWAAWRKAVGPPSKPLYRKTIKVSNEAAREIGFSDLGKYWKSKLGLKNGDLLRLTGELRDFYLKLHAYVRYHLQRYYGKDLVKTNEAIPAHLLGNMWAQSWSSLIDIFRPQKIRDYGITRSLKAMNMSVIKMAKSAEDFMVSLGLKKMPSRFWSNSQFVEPPSNARGSCHPSAINMFSPQHQDFRLLMCGNVDENTFTILHHEMGHIEYYMFYDYLPTMYKDAPHPAFHEAIGDSITYGALSPKHLRRLKLNATSSDPIMYLLHQALDKIPLLFWSLVVDQWRYDTFSGNISYPNYNLHWWKLRQRIQGVKPEGARPYSAFDPVAKFHVADNTPYLPYFLSGLLQVQLFKAMCEAEHGKSAGPLYNCDIYGSKRAGEILRKLMKKGSSLDWKTTLRGAIGTDEFSTGAIAEYYKPLIKWLDNEIRSLNIHVGWE